MKTIRIAGIDPALANVGLAIAELDIHSLDWKVVDIHLLQTSKGSDLKTVRQNSDDLRRARELHVGVSQYLKQWAVQIAIGEVPGGAQDARAAFSFGIATGLLAAVDAPLIEVVPREVQKGVLGFAGRDKEAIINWAVEQWPDLPWRRRMFRGAQRLLNDNEHMADACAIVKAGLATQQFSQAVRMMQAAYPKAA